MESISPAVLRYWDLSVLGSRVWPFRVTWCHRSRDCWILHRPFLIGCPLEKSQINVYIMQLFIPLSCMV